MRLLFYSVLMLLLHYSSMASLAMATGKNITTDQSALLAFKIHVADFRGVLSNNWSISYPLCSWIGISCDTHHHRVTALNLSDMGLTGTISQHLGNLSFLMYLDVSYNSFHGHLPNELGQLHRLKFVSFSKNELSGSLPSWIDVLPKLQIIILHNNSFAGPIPNSFFNLSKLETLDLGFNIIDGNIPSKIGNLSKLAHLFLAGNNLQDFKALVLEFMPNGSLEKWLYSHNYFLDILERLNIMIDVALAIEYLHHGHSSAPVVHCDLKPNNILLDEDMVAHVSDFGISKLLSEGDDSVTQTMTMATVGYMAPEYGSQGIVSVKCDVYSYGVLLMETFTRKKPTDNMFSGEMSLRNWVNMLLPDGLNEVVDANLVLEEQAFSAKMDCLLSIMHLALDCCMESPEQRIGMTDAAAKLKKIKEKLLDDVAATN